jgi:glucose-6-phosphate-specific signal transduction histidine kinase
MAVRPERHPLRSDVAEVALPSAPVSCRLAREFVLSVTGGPEDPRVALVVTELVTNAVVHGRARPVLRVAWDGDVVRIEVEDDGPGRPTLRPMSATTTSGRGLALVAFNVAVETGDHANPNDVAQSFVTKNKL